MAKRPAKASGGLTPKQEAFALAFFETGNAAEAYRRSYEVSADARDHWIYVEAGVLLDHPEIALRLQELREQAERHSIYTRQKAMEEYESARLLAEQAQNPSAAVSAVNGKVKLWGLEAPSRIRAEHTGKGGGPIEVETKGDAIDRIEGFLAGIAAREEAAVDPGEPDA